MNISKAPITSAHAIAYERKIVFLAGTYVLGISSPNSATELCLGILSSVVNDEPPKTS